MNRIKMYQVDAFTGVCFKGNPAAVCILEEWLEEKTMQSIAMENNLSETAFCVMKDTECELRWFTPEEEIDLCGHATLATAHVIFNKYKLECTVLKFATKSGCLIVEKEKDGLSMLFPTREGKKEKVTEQLIYDLEDALGVKPREVYLSRDVIVVFDREKDVTNLVPNSDKLRELKQFGVVITAPGKKVDFVSRYFAPSSGILEDPVTGSSHCSLIPYWAERLGKNDLIAYQASRRGGILTCTYLGDKVKITGKAAIFMEGEIIGDIEPSKRQIVQKFYSYMGEADFKKMGSLMNENVKIWLPNTREVFEGRANYILFNEKYPGKWNIIIEKLVEQEEVIVVYNTEDKENHLSFCCTAFIKFKQGLINEIIEYWGENGEPAKWRIEEGLSKKY